MQNKFAFFANFAETIRATLPLDKQAEAYKAICEFGIYGTLPEDPLLKGMCLMASVENGKKGGRPKKETQDITQTENQEVALKLAIFELHEEGVL